MRDERTITIYVRLSDIEQVTEFKHAVTKRAADMGVSVSAYARRLMTQDLREAGLWSAKTVVDTPGKQFVLEDIDEAETGIPKQQE
jgi:hypothetical protein